MCITYPQIGMKPEFVTEAEKTQLTKFKFRNSGTMNEFTQHGALVVMLDLEGDDWLALAVLVTQLVQFYSVPILFIVGEHNVDKTSLLLRMFKALNLDLSKFSNFKVVQGQKSDKMFINACNNEFGKRYRVSDEEVAKYVDQTQTLEKFLTDYTDLHPAVLCIKPPWELMDIPLDTLKVLNFVLYTYGANNFKELIWGNKTRANGLTPKFDATDLYARLSQLEVQHYESFLSTVQQSNALNRNNAPDLMNTLSEVGLLGYVQKWGLNVIITDCLPSVLEVVQQLQGLQFVNQENSSKVTEMKDTVDTLLSYLEMNANYLGSDSEMLLDYKHCHELAVKVVELANNVRTNPTLVNDGQTVDGVVVDSVTVVGKFIQRLVDWNMNLVVKIFGCSNDQACAADFALVTYLVAPNLKTGHTFKGPLVFNKNTMPISLDNRDEKSTSGIVQGFDETEFHQAASTMLRNAFRFNLTV